MLDDERLALELVERVRTLTIFNGQVTEKDFKVIIMVTSFNFKNSE